MGGIGGSFRQQGSVAAPLLAMLPKGSAIG